MIYYALTFHHVNPNTKDCDWSKLRKRNWKAICAELDKCICVCHNCHYDIHYSNNEYDNMIEFFATRKKQNEPVKGRCLECNSVFNVTKDKRKFCKLSCYDLWVDKNRIKLPRDIIDQMKTKSLTKIALEVGISRKNLTRRIKNLKVGSVVSAAVGIAGDMRD
jgi:hypothetical protein